MEVTIYGKGVAKILAKKAPGLAYLISTLANKSVDSITLDDLEYLRTIYGDDYKVIEEILKKNMNDS